MIFENILIFLLDLRIIGIITLPLPHAKKLKTKWSLFTQSDKSIVHSGSFLVTF